LDPLKTTFIKTASATFNANQINTHTTPGTRFKKVAFSMGAAPGAVDDSLGSSVVASLSGTDCVISIAVCGSFAGSSSKTPNALADSELRVGNEVNVMMFFVF
jgi:hypothetical protein